MKGLFAKDLALMMQRGKVLTFLVFWGILMCFVMKSPSFVVGWIVMIAAITSISTIGYDEYDNGMPHLMSMPVTRREYAVEKYLFALLLSVFFWLVSLVIVVAVSMITGTPFSLKEELAGMTLYLGLIMIILSVSIPPQLKWGAERGRIVMLVIFGVIFVGAFVFSKIGNRIEGIVSRLETLSMPMVVSVAAVICVLIMAVSILISIRIMEKKEF